MDPDENKNVQNDDEEEIVNDTKNKSINGNMVSLNGIRSSTTVGKCDFSSESCSIDHRFDILNCLLKRKRIYEDDETSPNSATNEKIYELSSAKPFDPDPNIYRVAVRCQLAQCFTECAQSHLGLEDTLPSCQEYCAMLAWKLENVLFKNNSDKERYLEKGRGLKANLKRNPILCSKVLIGKLDLESLVNLTSDELAGKKALHRKEEAVKNAEKKKIVDASDADFGMVGLLQNRASSLLIKSSEKLDPQDAKPKGIIRNFILKTKPPSSPRVFMPEISPVINTSPILEQHDILALTEPEDTNNGPALNIQLPDFDELMANPPANYSQLPDSDTEMNYIEKSSSLTEHRKPISDVDIETLQNEPNKEKNDVTTSSNTEDQKAETRQISLPSLEPLSLTRQTSLDWEFKKTPEGGGPVFFFKMKEKVVISFTASLRFEKNPDISGLPPFPYDLNEDRSISFESLIDFLVKKYKQCGASAFIFCRLSLANTLIDNQEKYKQFRRTYEEKERVPIIKLGGDLSLYLIVPKLGMQLQRAASSIEGMMKGKIESTHLVIHRG